MQQKQLEQVKEDLEDILKWARDSNRKLAVECIYEIADHLLDNVNLWLLAHQPIAPAKIDFDSLPEIDENGNIEEGWKP